MPGPEVIRVDPLSPEPEAIARAAELLLSGGLVAFPTETVYGLGADGLNPAAVARIYAVKGRPAEKGLILHLDCFEMLPRLVETIPPAARPLIARFAPGPLTLVLRARPVVPEVVRGGGSTVAVRWPAHPVARALIRAVGRPLAAPSANLSGDSPPTDARAVVQALGERIDLVLDAGRTPVGTPSTLVDLTGERPAILRSGAIPPEQVWAALSCKQSGDCDGEHPADRSS